MKEITIESVVGRVSKRLMWFIIVLYCLAILDRGAAGFAAITMTRELHLSAEMFGLGTGLFFIAYLSMEIPSNMALQRFGARMWISRIAVSWGIVVAATALTTGAHSFYSFRFLLGIAEAGLFPGIVYYLTLWIPKRFRARYYSIFMMAIPATIALAAPVSTSILRLDGIFGLSGWQWIFLLEGVPSIVAGVFAWFYLTDKPSSARWLTAEEKQLLEHALAQDATTEVAKPNSSAWGALADVRVIMLGLVYGGINVGLTMAANWMPQIVHSVFKSYSIVAVTIAIPFACAAIAMVYWGHRSDRRGERIIHVALALLASGAGWVFSGYAASPLFVFGGLFVGIVALYAAMGVFWAIPPSYLSGRAAASGIALVSATGHLASALSPAIVGRLKDQSGNFSSGLVLVGVVSIFCSGLLVTLKVMEKRSKAVANMAIATPAARVEKS